MTIIKSVSIIYATNKQLSDDSVKTRVAIISTIFFIAIIDNFFKIIAIISVIGDKFGKIIQIIFVCNLHT